MNDFMLMMTYAQYMRIRRFRRVDPGPLVALLVSGVFQHEGVS